MNQQVNHGFIPSVIDQAVHYVLGDGFLAVSILMPTGHGWGAYLPKDEFQNKNGLETMNCTCYGTFNVIETIGRLRYGASFQSDLSERYLGILANTSQNGNDPHTVAETIRTIAGSIPEVFLPFDQTIDTWKKYYSPKPITYALFKVGYSWMKKYQFGHDWVLGNTKADLQANMKNALRYSPLGVSGFAWSEHNDGLYYSDGPVCHWFTVYDYVDGQYWMVFDSYDKTHKRLNWNYDFGQVKRYALNRRLGSENTDTEVRTSEVLFAYIKYFIKNIFS